MIASAVNGVRLTDRQTKIKAGLDRGDAVSKIAEDAGTSRSAVYATAKRLTVLDPEWKPQTVLTERSLSDKGSKVAAAQNSTRSGISPPEPTEAQGGVDGLRISIATYRESIEARLVELANERDRLLAAEEALA